VPERLRVAILGGGRSSEHDVSLRSAESVAGGLDPNRFEVVAITIARDGVWTGPDGAVVSVTPGQGGPLGCDVVFPVLHGPFGEDGTVQGLLEMLGVPYVGSGVLGAALTMDKERCKAALRDAGIDVAREVLVGQPMTAMRSVPASRTSWASPYSSSPRGSARAWVSPASRRPTTSLRLSIWLWPTMTR
jgi:D-alanine--D-alanine ligase